MRDVEAFLVVADFRAVPVFAVEERDAPAPADFARLVDAFFAPPVERFAVEVLLLLRDVPELARDADPELDAVVPSVPDHFPDMTRCAASATASAMIDPSLVALDMTLLAARSALSAASRPASRIFLRAAGLALIAAAAAASPAASISLLIAALASLSMVSPPLDRDDDDFELGDFEPDDEERDVFRADFAMLYPPQSLTRHTKAVAVPE